MKAENSMRGFFPIGMIPREQSNMVPQVRSVYALGEAKEFLDIIRIADRNRILMQVFVMYFMVVFY